MKIQPWHEIKEEDLKRCRGPRGGLDEFEVARLLERKSCLKHARIYPKLNLYYVYDKTRGIYAEMYQAEMRSFVAHLAYSISNKIARVRMVIAICNELLYGPLSEPGEPHFDKENIVFRNGVLNLRTSKFGLWTPDKFVVSRVEYNFDPKATCPNIDQFLLEVCEGHKDRCRFIHAWLYTLLHGNSEGQIFLYVWGRGGSGKSTLANVITAFIGKPASITTTLRALHKDPFEMTNLRGKRLILISDTEYYKGDLSVLKMITGGDSVTGRIKFVQGAHEVNIEGQVLIVGNYPLGSRDTSESIVRRLRTLPANTRVENRVFNLINYRNNAYTGVLVNELPGLMNTVLKFNEVEALKIVCDEKLTPSLATVQRETEERANPVLRWVREELCQGEGAYLGYKTSSRLLKDEDQSPRRHPVLYPTFESWATRNGLNTVSHVHFSNVLLNCLQSEGYKSEKSHSVKGVFISGVMIRSQVHDPDYIYGAPTVEVPDPCKNLPSSPGIEGVQSEHILTTLLNEGSKGDIIPGGSDKNILLGNYSFPQVSRNLYWKYLSLLGNTPLKEKLNTVSKKFYVDIEDVANKFLKNCKLRDLEYRGRVIEILQRAKENLSAYGAIPYTYKPLGVSPRVFPVGYGKTLNNSKKVFREEVYRQFGDYVFSELNARVVDIDLVSCYVSILIGLYPKDLHKIRTAIEGEGLWKYIENEFAEHNNSSAYNKPAAKICVYASVFQGGNRAMMSGILESFRKDVGLRPQQFKEFSGYEECSQVAQGVVSQMQKSTVVTSFRQLAHNVSRSLNGKTLKGPTGHEYPVTPESFRSSYPNYLQSFEFSILSLGTIYTLKEIQGAEVIGHYHDGNVIIVPDDKFNEFKERLDHHVLRVGDRLGLVYPQRVECKTYPPLDQ